jgi:hypothetical protein
LANPGVLSIFNKGFRENVNLQIKIVDSPDVTSEIFIDDLRHLLIPSVKSNHSMLGCQNKSAILFIDHCTCHCSDGVKRELAEHRILLIIYPPRPSHLFEVLDTVLFGKLKAAKKRVLRDLTLGREINHLMGKFRAYEWATIGLTVKSEWEKAGFGYERRDGTAHPFVNAGKIRASSEFAEIWAIDYPEDRLSPRKHQQA